MNSLNINIDIRLDLNARKGETFQKVIIVNDVAGVAYDFTGHVVELALFTRAGETTPDLVFNLADGLTLVAGQITLNKSAAKMDIQGREYIYFLKVTKPDTTVKMWLNGIFNLHDGLFSGNPQDSDTTQFTIAAFGTPLTLIIGDDDQILGNIGAGEGDVLQWRGGKWTKRTLAELAQDLTPYLLNP